MRGRGARTGRWTAYAVAFVLAVQASLLAFASGAGAAPLPRDQFGNVLCTPGGNGPHDPSHDTHGADRTCCTLGCPMLGGPPPLEANGAPAPAFALSDGVRFAPRTDPAAAAPRASPRQARAPPLAVAA